MPGLGPHTLGCTHNSPFPQDLQRNPDSGSAPHPPRASGPPLPACSPFSWAGGPGLSIRCPPHPGGLYSCTFRPQQSQRQTAGGWNLLAASPASASPQGPEDPLVHTQVSALLPRLQDPAPGTLQSNSPPAQEGSSLALPCPPSPRLGRRVWALTPRRWVLLSLRAARQGRRDHSHLLTRQPMAPGSQQADGSSRQANQGPTPAPSLALPGEDSWNHSPAPPAPLSGAAMVGPASQPGSVPGTPPQPRSPAESLHPRPRAHLGERARSPPGGKGMACFRRGFVSS